MPNISIELYNYSVPVPNHQEWYRAIRQLILQKIPNLIATEVDIYTTEGEVQKLIEVGNENRLVILVNSTYDNGQGAEPQTTVNKLFGIELGMEIPVLKASQTGVPIMDGDLPIAEYIPGTNELNVLFNLFATYDENWKKVLEKILESFEKEVWYPKTLFHSWKLTPDKKALTAELIEKVKKSKEDILLRDKRELNELEARVLETQRDLKTYYDRMYSKRVSVDAIETTLKDVPAKVIQEMDMIADHPKVTDLRIKDGKYIVTTVPLYCYTQGGRRYYLGTCRIELKPEISEVRFFNEDNTRPGYWTGEDPHPHVNGSNGIACLGSAAPGIVELSAQNQIYALVLLCIDFLESANTGDPAGRRITSWDEVDEEGNIIRESNPDEEYDEDEDFGQIEDDEEPELYDVYERVTMNIDEDENIYFAQEGHHEVDEEERNANYVYHEEAGVWVRGA